MRKLLHPDDLDPLSHLYRSRAGWFDRTGTLGHNIVTRPGRVR